MKQLLFLGIFFFFPVTKAFDITMDEIESDKAIKKLSMAQGFSLPDMQVKFDIFVSPESVLYEMPKFFINGQEVKCLVCGQCPVMIEYKKEKLISYCLVHAPKKDLLSWSPTRPECNVVPPIPDSGSI
jgi:hypothetical protein